MKLTKYAHACIVLEEQGQKAIIDPGEFTPDFGDISGVAAVVVTHIHGDHFSAGHLQNIISANPDVKIFTTVQVAQEFSNPHVQAVKAGDEQTAGAFTFHFFGELHAAVHPEWPQDQNIGVMVNNTLYYPGDSFTVPDRAVEVLAVPASAPWLKVGESVEFIKEVKPEQLFRTHDGLFNERGIALVDRWFTMAGEKFGSQYQVLNPGGSITIQFQEI